jgi:hypothetical protein
MKYLLIENKGEICVDALSLMGGSSKRNDNTKLGRFGSGNKYSIAAFLKMNIDFKIFSGINEISITTEPYQFRDVNLDKIFINNKETSLTVQMGPDWVFAWMAVREWLQNAVDEGEMNVVVGIENLEGKQDKTRCYIEINQEIQEVVDNWDNYFTFDRTDEAFTSKEGSIFPNRDINNDLILFARGIKCTNYKNLKSLYHYSGNISMNESRIIEQDWMGKELAGKLLAKTDNTTVIYNILKRAAKERFYENSIWESWLTIPSLSASWKEVIGDKKIIVDEIAGWFENIQQKYEHFIVSDRLAKRIHSAFPDVEIFGLSDNDNKIVQKKPAQLDNRKKFLLKECNSFLKETDYLVEYPIEVVQFSDGNTLGLAENGIIYLSEKVFDMGKREIVITIMEENEHLKTKYKDCSRALQQHLFNKWISEKEERFAIFL